MIKFHHFWVGSEHCWIWERVAFHHCLDPAVFWSILITVENGGWVALREEVLAARTGAGVSVVDTVGRLHKWLGGQAGGWVFNHMW